jgi:pyridoxal phosphate enzyme (YggS family)
MSIADNIRSVQAELNGRAKLIAVSKTKPVADIMEAYHAGQKVFGENKVQELCEKYEALPKDIEWHMIGHVQTNKVKYMAPFVYMIHGVDSLKLAAEINKQAMKHNRTVRCLFQIHIAREDTKFGFDPEEIMELAEGGKLPEFPGIIWSGVMGMATFTEDMEQVRAEFRSLKKLFDKLKLTYFSASPEFCEISMGMSGDWRIAVEEGSTMVRIGSAIFGERMP